MLSFLNRLNLIRYLIVWRVNSSLAFCPRYLSIDLSMVIGNIISRRLPTQEISPWRKALDPLVENFAHKHKNRQPNELKKVADVSWPIKSVLYVYPGKRTFGRDELIFWELKLFDEHADHGLFLEIILPAMEEASYTSDNRWNRRNRLWGHFDIEGIYAARGRRWEPVVKEGKLDLRYRVNPTQWLEKLSFSPKSSRQFKTLNWITPFDLSEAPTNPEKFNMKVDMRILRRLKAPTLSMILMGFVSRFDSLMHGKWKHSRNIMNDEDKSHFQQALIDSLNISIKKKEIQPVPPTWPGKWIGIQKFETIPPMVLPYLEAASILHIGKQTHFGCGTFEIT